MIINGVDTIEFGKRVERFCDFFLNKISKDGSPDVKVILDLKEDAACIQFEDDIPNTMEDHIVGLDTYTRGGSLEET